MITPPPLNTNEEQVILYKGTEPPFSGKYNQHSQNGIYLCRKCGSPLYRSEDKFSSHCGWPSFDDELPGRVERRLDSDGQRLEIICQCCGGHLGHVFEGERMTPKNTRHCVNSLSLIFFSYAELKKYACLHPEEFQVVYVAGGCFWQVEKRIGELTGVLASLVGYTGGISEHPTYRDVCSQTTKHAETVEAIIDLKLLSLSSFYHQFLTIHDPTQLNRQGPDIGDQYRSAIFFKDEKQKTAALGEIEKMKSERRGVVTTLEPLKEFWPAEEEHQHYLKKKKGIT